MTNFLNNYVICVTGGIGSGKTTVARLFATLGARVVDTDEIAHELTAAGGLAMPEIAGAFGKEVIAPDGSLNRTVMRQLCFAAPSSRQQLEQILHPKIRAASLARCEELTTAPYVLLVVPLLVEAGAQRVVADRTLVIDCDESVQVARVMQRSHLSEAEVRAIMATQATRTARLSLADDTIVNNGDVDALTPQVTALHRQYQAFAAEKKSLSET